MRGRHFTQFVQQLGRGKRGAKTLSEQQAYEAMNCILTGDVQPEQVGAFWMLIRMREETVEETVGFTRAAREHLGVTFADDSNHEEPAKGQRPDIDWPAYAGKRSELPWFVLSAMTLAQAGFKVVMHGYRFNNEERIFVEDVVGLLGIPVAQSRTQAYKTLSTENIVYLPLAAYSPELAEQMALKDTLGLRSPVNTVVRICNPLGATHSVHGVFHSGYDTLHLEAAKLLGDHSMAVFRGGNGEAEVNPERDVCVSFLQNGVACMRQFTKSSSGHIHQKDNLDLSRLRDHWLGMSNDTFGEQAVIETLAVVLCLIHVGLTHEEARHEALQMWLHRAPHLMAASVA
ncbi:glycosyl transferase family protein [Maribrevibacterium harenarium]|uniref:Glycosyl transferase family protein n=1 Tax=Maribrevibacterium harenarium TaxID=2589817 RepID=A0A501WWH8_9GAMM|nr:glycosyl transferase family protein [Maribrevibacterium harenarium]TPE52790.1 glycosyl transferase family protein [Maribrevibacterium harenarium]